MGHKGGVFLHLARIAQIVVNAVGIVGRGRKPKQPRLVDRHGLVEIGVVECRHPPWGCEAFGDVQIDDILFVLDQSALFAFDLVGDGDKDHLARAARFGRHRPDGRTPPELFTDAQHAGKDEPPGRPHAPLERQGRKEIAQFRMPVRAQLPKGHEFGKGRPMPQRWQKRPRPHVARQRPVMTDGSAQHPGQVRGQTAPALLTAPDPIGGITQREGLTAFCAAHAATFRPSMRATVSPMLDGLGATMMPASCKISTFSCALSPKAEMIAPAWPILRPLGADNPAT